MIGDYDTFIFDLDGVVYRGEHAVPGAIETIQALTATGAQCVYVTNNAGRPGEVVAEHLRSLGLSCSIDQVITSPQAVAAAAEKLRGLRGDQIAVIGSGRMTNEELFMLRKLAAALKTEWIDIVPRSGEPDNYLVSADRNPNTAGAKLIFTDQPGAALATIRQKVDAGEIKAVVAWRENLLKGAGFTAKALGRLDFLLCAHVMANSSAEHAHVVLPTAAWAEKRGSMINATGRLQRLNKATEPPAQARDDWEALRDLTQALTGSNGLYLVEDVFKAMAAEIGELAGLSLGKIGDAGLPLLSPAETIPLLAREADRKAKGVIVG